jgi:hypothetical protein
VFGVAEDGIEAHFHHHFGWERTHLVAEDALGEAVDAVLGRMVSIEFNQVGFVLI